MGTNQQNGTGNKGEVREFWERHPCGAEYVDAATPYLSPKFFDDSARIRYKYHYHIPRDIKILSKLKPGGKALEIGVGIGCDTELLIRNGFEVSGIDLTDAAAEATKARLKHHGLSADVKQGDAENLPFPDKNFDVVYSFGVLHHSPDTQKTLDEVHRVLKPGGLALIMLYHKDSLNYWAHVITNTQYDGFGDDRCPVERSYTKSEVQNMFQKFSTIDPKPDYLFGTGWGRVNWFAPEFIKRPIGKYFGWHLMIWATK
jgi:ubiquinone/menaquinone biosynthesis C-methylase UbiE